MKNPDQVGHYSTEFYRSVDERARGTASTVLGLLKDMGALRSGATLVDLGCGSGAWTGEFSRSGAFSSIIAMDLPSSIDYLLEAKAKFSDTVTLVSADFCADNFRPPAGDLIVSTEVLEHLPADCALRVFRAFAQFEAVLFSAAQPGQGGTHHVNERPMTYWVQEARGLGFLVYDPFRKSLLSDPSIPRFYGHNLLLFVRPGSLTHQSILRTGLVPDVEIVPDLRSPFEKLRYSVLRVVPHRLVTKLSRVRAAAASVFGG